MQNIRILIPVVEMRLNHFGGSESKLSKANLHVLFDPDLAPEVIESQFLNALTSEFNLAPGGENVWSGAITRSSLTDLGAQIKASVPADRLKDFGSDLIEGFNSLTVSLDSVTSILERPYFKNRALLALGKTEWGDIKWVDGAIADKKHLINKADIIFTAFKDSSSWKTSRTALKNNSVNASLLDCSDAHTWGEVKANKDRLGNCDTWLNAAPTFSGLVHALSEFEDRVFVGREPEDLKRLKVSPERIIRSVSVRPKVQMQSPLFDYSVPLNQGLVAIIGNKGKGKSAFLDCIARGGNSARSKHFAFLNRSRFLSVKNKSSSMFEVELTTADGRSRLSGFDDEYDAAQLERVEYLPQSLIESICASDPLSPAQGEFEHELSRVLFHHIDEVDRAGLGTLEDLLALRTKSLDASTFRLRQEIEQKSRRLIDLDRELNEVSLDNLLARRREIQLQIDAAQLEMAAAQLRLDDLETGTSESAEVQADRTELAQSTARIEVIRDEIAALKVEAATLSKTVTEVRSLEEGIQRLKADADELNGAFSALLDPLVGDVVTLVVDKPALDAIRQAHAQRQMEIAKELDVKQNEIEGLSANCVAIAKRLESEDSAREAERKEVEQLKVRVSGLVGDIESPDSATGLDKRIVRLTELPGEITIVNREILELCETIYETLQQRVGVIREIYRPAAEFASGDLLAREAGITFSADIRFSADWVKIGSSLDGRRNADTFSMLESSKESMDVNDAADVMGFVSEFLKRLTHDSGDPRKPGRALDAAFKSSTTPIQSVASVAGLSWLETSFSLSGKGLPLSQLSPGERGLILLLFYLVLDRSDAPLLLDQPEENLDNSAVRSVLVPALRQARKRRQVIVVTHNANLAVVGDADQIVHCRYEGGVFSIASGPLASTETGEVVIDILEGARPAFDNRRQKYDRVVISR